eukprot:7598011-Prorocentrum_lima.AAC.1
MLPTWVCKGVSLAASPQHRPHMWITCAGNSSAHSGNRCKADLPAHRLSKYTSAPTPAELTAPTPVTTIFFSGAALMRMALL